MRSALTLRFGILVVSLTFTACKKAAAVDATTLDTSLVASLERGPCRGTCPVYRVNVYGDGRVHFDGKQHVGTIGVQDGRTTVEAIQHFMRSVATTEFSTADSSFVMDSAACGSYQTDLPMATLSIKVGTRMKSIQHDPGCRNAPKFLRVLEFQLDTVAQTARWIAGNGETK